MAKKKKYALNNSYFKNIQFQPEMPSKIIDIAAYLDEHGELPFEYSGDNWIYDAFCEKQKRSGVINSQFLTPDSTAEIIAELALKYQPYNEIILDCCIGTGQLTKAIYKLDPEQNIHAFDNDFEMTQLSEWQFDKKYQFQCDHLDFTNEKDKERIKSQYRIVVSNPPYEKIYEFLTFTREVLEPNGVAILLIPEGSMEKSRPEKYVKELMNWNVIEKIPMQEDFERTKIRASIHVLKLRD